jgi:hypothetical protein
MWTITIQEAENGWFVSGDFIEDYTLDHNFTKVVTSMDELISVVKDCYEEEDTKSNLFKLVTGDKEDDESK